MIGPKESKDVKTVLGANDVQEKDSFDMDVETENPAKREPRIKKIVVEKRGGGRGRSRGSEDGRKDDQIEKKRVSRPRKDSTRERDRSRRRGGRGRG